MTLERSGDSAVSPSRQRMGRAGVPAAVSRVPQDETGAAFRKRTRDGVALVRQLVSVQAARACREAGEGKAPVVVTRRSSQRLRKSIRTQQHGEQRPLLEGVAWIVEDEGDAACRPNGAEDAARPSTPRKGPDDGRAAARNGRADLRCRDAGEDGHTFVRGCARGSPNACDRADAVTRRGGRAEGEGCGFQLHLAKPLDYRLLFRLVQAVSALARAAGIRPITLPDGVCMR